MEALPSVLMWSFLIAFGVVMMVLSPRDRSEGGFFRGEAADGRSASTVALTASLFISWIFAKSVTNAANLGFQFGVVGGLAYAVYWLSIPVAGFAILSLRKSGATGLVSFLSNKYGSAAALTFSVAILVRLYNEIWSNTAVVGSYFGPAGSISAIAAALGFTGFTLLYSIRGGVRASIFTDLIQAWVFGLFLIIVFAFITPNASFTRLATEGEWTLIGGVDLVFVALLQVLSYPFHDPVLTDRGFITHTSSVKKSYLLAGGLGFLAILLFSFVGIQARVAGLEVNGDAPVVMARLMGLPALVAMSLIMMTSAGSTLDSALTSAGRLIALDRPGFGKWSPRLSRRLIGVGAMIALAVVGNIPLFFGADILKATTISGTMVIGLAPVFLCHRFVSHSPLSFHLSFWTGMILGIGQVVGLIPSAFAIGQGSYALLLGVNVYGTVLCFVGFFAPVLVKRWVRDRGGVPVLTGGESKSA